MGLILANLPSLNLTKFANMTTTTSAPGDTPGNTPGHTPVNITAAYIVKFANPKSADHLPSPFRLGPLDHLAHTGVPIDLVFVYEKPHHVQPEDFIPIARLRDALSTLLNYYPHLTGRLQVDHSNGVRSITKLGTGASLFEASCDQPLSPSQLHHMPGWEPQYQNIPLDMHKLPGAGEALIAPSFPSAVPLLSPLAARLRELGLAPQPPPEGVLATTVHWDPSFDDETGIQRGPLLLIQRTQFKCGCVAIGYRISHAVCAAEGCIHLYQDLCDIYRKLSRRHIGTLDLPPHIIPFGADRITDEEQDLDYATEYPPYGYIVSSQPGEALLGGDADKHIKSSTVTSDTSDTIVDTYLHYCPRRLANLKTKATNPDDPDSWVSTFEALLAHLWQQTHQARVRLASDKAHRMPTGIPPGVPLPKDCLPTPTLWTSINFAHPSRLDLAGQGKSHYFPNATLPVFLTVPEDDVLLEDAMDLYDAPLWQVARLIHDGMRHPETTSTEYALAVCQWMCDLPDKRLAKVDFDLFGRWCFVNADWREYELYGRRTALDHGVQAALAGPPSTKVSRLDGFTTFVKARGRGRVIPSWLEDYNGGIDVRLTMNQAASRYRDGWFGRVVPSVGQSGS